MKKNIVMTFGTFDINDSEDVSFLKQSQKYGDFFITIVTCDRNILNLKGKKTKHNEQQRFKYVQNLGIANLIELANPKNCFSALKKYKPQVITLKSDQLDLLYKLSEFLYENKLKTNVVTIDSNEISNKNLLGKTKNFIPKAVLETEIGR